MNYCPFCMEKLNGKETNCRRCGKEPSSYSALPHVLPPGALLNNRYLVGAVIGEGGFGITYVGLDSLLEYRVAIKEFYPNGMVSRNSAVSNEVRSISAESAQEVISKSREHFLSEARMLARFNNEKGIVEVKDFFEENGTVYIVMEYLDGITLKNYLKRVGTISAFNTICLLMPVFDSLNKIHRSGLIHRDISPDNIMLVDEEVKLLDFGAARQFADEKSLSVMLKHGYAPLEQYRRHGAQGSWTDVYAICATIYKCITGQIPPDAPDRIYEDELKMPSELGFDTSPEFEAVLRHGLAIKADERIQDIDELLQELSAVPGFESAAGELVPETAAKPKPAPAPQPEPDDGDKRFSEVVTEPEPEEPASQPPKPEPAPASPEKPAKSGGKTGLVIAVCAVTAVIAGAGIFFAKSGGGDDGNSSSKPEKSSSVADSTVSADSKASAEGQEQSQPQTVSEEDSSSEPESLPDSSSEDDSTAGKPIDRFEYSFTVTDRFFTMNTDAFGASLDDVEATYGMPSGSEVRDDPDWMEGEAVLSVPVQKEFVISDGAQSDSEVYVKLFFKADKLVMAMYQYAGGYSQDAVMLAKAAFGDPVSDNDTDAEWLLDDGSLYQIYLRSQDGEEFFAQMYVSNVFLKETGILE